MKTVNSMTSACRYCQYYKPEGRRGGVCQQLGVPVRASWIACSLALKAFAPSWESLEGIMRWQDENLRVQRATSSKCAITCSQQPSDEQENASSDQQSADDALLV
ncbi:hypothetical protein H6F61_03160 [Cyanobacteria bacterium FACHB-472]|nr:hypothetical protein [Cyanobacteria bacterium FACHB-472]